MYIINQTLVHHFQNLMPIVELHIKKQWFDENYMHWLSFVTYVYL